MIHQDEEDYDQFGDDFDDDEVSSPPTSPGLASQGRKASS
jgi:hypothetical protein